MSISSMYCMCTSPLRLHNSLPAGTCGSSSQGTKLLYISAQPPHDQKARTHHHTTARKMHEHSTSNQLPHKNHPDDSQ